MGSKDKLIEDLSRENRCFSNKIDDLNEKNAQLTQRLSAAIEALQPFADVAEHYDSSFSDDYETLTGMELRAFRQAAILVREHPKRA